MIDAAWAQGAGQGPATGDLILLMMLPIFLFVFILWPQMRRQKQHQKMVGGLEVGDEAVTSGGVLGKITKLDENFITLEVAKGTEIKVQRHAIGAVMPKGTIKGA